MMKEAPEAMKIAEASEANSGKMAEEQAAVAAAVKKNVKGNDEARRPKKSSDLEKVSRVHTTARNGTSTLQAI